jgi:hypothetical protein
VLLAVLYKTLELWAIIGLARNCPVAVFVYHYHIILEGEVVALPELTLYGFLTLIVA